MKQFKTQQFQSSLGTIRYLDDESDGIPILFIHGLGCLGTVDYPSVAACSCLSENRKLIVDLLGSGISDKPENLEYTLSNQLTILKEFIDYLNLEKIIVFGHSMGGSIAINLANEIKKSQPTLIISEANLENGGGFFSSKIAAYAYSEFLTVGYAKIIAENYANGNTKWAESIKSTLPKALYDEAVSLVMGQTKSWRTVLYELPCPKTFIFGEKSLPDNDYMLLKQNNIHLEIVKNAGHSMAWENPEGLAQAIAHGIAIGRK